MLRWRIIFLVSLAVAVSYLDRQTLPVAIKAIEQDIPISNQQFALLQTAFLFTYAIMYAVGGRVIDVLGTRRGFVVVMVVLDADVSSSTKTAAFGRRHPHRFFNLGVAEANMADIAGGMATCGLPPVVSTFALFLILKAADQIRNVTCYDRLPVVFAGGYGGLSDSYDGASHQSIEDLAVMRALPNLAVVVPGDPTEVKTALDQALRRDGPTYLRLERNPSPVLFAGEAPLEIGRIRKLRDGGDVTIAVCGIPTAMALAAAEELARGGVQADVLRCPP